MEIYWIRHTRPLVNSGVCYGQSDIELASTFKAEASQIRSKLPPVFDRIYTSPLSRCHRLALTLFPNQVPVSDEKLMELNFGEWELFCWNDLPPSQLKPWMEDYVNKAPPGGESMIEMKVRVVSWLDNLPYIPEQKIAIFTHAGVIRIIWTILNHKDLKEAFSLSLDYGAILQTPFPIK